MIEQLKSLSDEEVAKSHEVLKYKTGDDELDYYWGLFKEIPDRRGSPREEERNGINYSFRIKSYPAQVASWVFRRFKNYYYETLKKDIEVDLTNIDEDDKIDMLKGRQGKIFEDIEKSKFIEIGFKTEQRKEDIDCNDDLDIIDMKAMAVGGGYYKLNKFINKLINELEQKTVSGKPLQETEEIYDGEWPQLNKLVHRFALLHELGIIKFLNENWFSGLQEAEKMKLISLILGLDKTSGESIRENLRNFQNIEPGKANFTKVTKKSVRSQLVAIGLIQFED